MKRGCAQVVKNNHAVFVLRRTQPASHTQSLKEVVAPLQNKIPQNCPAAGAFVWMGSRPGPGPSPSSTKTILSTTTHVKASGKKTGEGGGEKRQNRYFSTLMSGSGKTGGKREKKKHKTK